jgi:hypothetical protein
MDEKDKTPKFGRRDILKGIITLPVLGAIAYGAFKKKRNEQILIKQIRDELNLNFEPPVIVPNTVLRDGSKLRIGIVGYGIRGEQLMRAAGFAQPTIIDEYAEAAKKDSNDKRLIDFREQEDLSIIVTGVCDLFDLRAQKAMAASANLNREGKNGKFGEQAKRFKTYKDLLASPDIAGY